MENLAILTGEKGSTYYQFGLDLQSIIEGKCKKPFEVKESAGSLENLTRLGSREAAQLAIVQSDVLDYVRFFEAEKRDFARWYDQFRYVFPLYDEEVHIVTLKELDIRELSDLEGKTIAVGAQDSGTKVTATFLLHSQNIQARPLLLAPTKPWSASFFLRATRGGSTRFSR